MNNNNCNNHGNCACHGPAGDEDEFYDFSAERDAASIASANTEKAPVEEKKTREIIHPKNNEELEQILASIPEIGGSKTEENPTAHGDWALKGRVSDF